MDEEVEIEEDVVEKKDALFKSIGQAGMLQPEDRKELAHIMRGHILQRALHEILITADAKAQIMMGVDLTTQEGLMQAKGLQAEARALSSVVESFVEYAYPPKPDEEEENHD